MSDTKTVYISIGNSDDKLTQQEWAAFHGHADRVIRGWAVHVHGAWVSPSTDPWQNACWCVEVDATPMVRSDGTTVTRHEGLRRTLAKWAAEYRQDSIAWAEATTEFISAEVSER